MKSVGAFCSFAPGSDVVENHAIEYLSTHPFLYYGGESDRKCNELEGRSWYFPDVIPKGNNYKLEKIYVSNNLGKAG